MKNRIYLLALGLFPLCILFLLACQEPSSDQTDTKTETDAKNEKEEMMKSGPLEAQEVIYTWVDNLNLRDQGSKEGKTIGQVQTSDALTFTGERSPEVETVVLRGVVYDEPWLKVSTQDGKEGWVFGGAVKRKHEQKGNVPMDKMILDFPYFGRYDLNEWTFAGTRDDSGGDAEIGTKIYTKDGQVLEISAVEVGEYGYSYDQKLLDESGQILKERSLRFAVDMDFRELYEQVIDHTHEPPQKHFRSQKMAKHYMQLDSRPVMANGTWETATLEE